MQKDGRVLIRVVGWNHEKKWGHYEAHSRNILVGMLLKSSALSNLEAKRAIKKLLAGPNAEIQLSDGQSYASFLHLLQSLGAEVEAIPQKMK